MSGFNWDDHPIVDPKAAAAPAAPAAFNWDDHPIVNQKEQGLGERLVRGALKTLPAIGAVGAGILATPESGGLATIPAAAAGGMAGKSLQNTLEKLLFDEGAKSYTDMGQGLVKAGIQGAEAETGGQIIGAVPGLVRSGVQSAKGVISRKLGPNLEYTPVKNADAIVEAAKKLGIENVPRGVLTDNPTFQKLESGLSQSGTLPAKGVRDQYNQFFKGLDKATEKIHDLKTPDSDFALGRSIQEDLGKQVEASRVPVKELYDNVVPDLRKIPVDQGVVNKVFGQLKKQPIFQTQQGRAFLEEHKGIISGTEDLASLKEIRSSLNGLVNQNSVPAEMSRVKALRDAVTSIRDNSMEAMKSQLPKNMHSEVDDLIQKVALADSAHASNVQDINSIKSIVGNKDFSSPTKFLSRLGESKEAELAQKASNLDVESLRNLQSKYPSVFQKAKVAKINDMVQRSTNPSSGFNELRFIKQYDSMDKELKDLVFSPEIQSHIENLKLVKQSIPDKLGPSGTPEGIMTMEMFSPRRNILDYGIKKALDSSKGPQGAEAALQSLRGAPNPSSPLVKAPLLRVLQGEGKTAVDNSIELPRAADKDETPIKKGPDKWANDGFQKLQKHDETGALQDPELIDKLMKSKEGKKLLIAASDLTPGSKAMDRIFSQIKSTYVEGKQ